jgi:hypothetical protein
MKLRRIALAVLVTLLVLAFVGLLAVWLRWPPEGDSFRAFVARETVKVTLQLLGLSCVGGIVSWLVREARERRDFALRLRDAYGNAKAHRRRLRRLPSEGRSTELDLLERVQLKFEDLRDEAEWTYGSRSKIVINLTLIEKYLHDVVDAGFSGPARDKPGLDNFQDFIAKYHKDSRFAKNLKKPYHSIRKVLR